MEFVSILPKEYPLPSLNHQNMCCAEVKTGGLAHYLRDLQARENHREEVRIQCHVSRKIDRHLPSMGTTHHGRHTLWGSHTMRTYIMTTPGKKKHGTQNLQQTVIQILAE